MNKFQHKIRIQLMTERQLILSQLDKEREDQLPSQAAIRLQLDKQMHRKLERIASALERIEKASFGTCLRCGQEIDSDRLKSNPEAELCINCQQRIERNQIHRYTHAYA